MPFRDVAFRWFMSRGLRKRRLHLIQSIRYSSSTSLKNAVDFLSQQKGQVDSNTYASLLRECGKCSAISEGRRLHDQIIASGLNDDTFLGNLVVKMYGDCGNIDEAIRAFDRITKPNVVSWTLMITAYAQNGHMENARGTFEKMPHWDVVPWTSMMAAYAQIGHMQEAKDMFDTMPARNVVSWNAMITAYARNGQGNEALQLFKRIQLEGLKPNRISYISLLDACISLADLREGMAVDSRIVECGFQTDVMVGTALVNMYGKCGSPEAAQDAFDRIPQKDLVAWNALVAAYAQNGHVSTAKSVFDRMPEKNVVSWSTVIAAYGQNGHGKEALELLPFMDMEGVQPNKVTFVSVLDACSSIPALAEGKAIHASFMESGFQTDIMVDNAIVNMYGKCGSTQDARTMFNKMPVRNEISWNAMISAYAQHGYTKEALELFPSMDLDGAYPNKVTFISVLSACSHAGRLQNGWQYFVSMTRDYGITPAMEHYMCMIDLLGRAGQLGKAEELISSMPYQADSVAWTAFLGGCRMHGDLKRADLASEHVFQLDSDDASPYVMLLLMYAAAGNHDAVAQVRKKMKDKGVKLKNNDQAETTELQQMYA